MAAAIMLENRGGKQLRSVPEWEVPEWEAHDLLVLSYHARAHQEPCCEFCGVPVVEALVLDGSMLCASCYDSRYNELGFGD